jgi:parallel beta-helix repeat protein
MSNCVISGNAPSPGIVLEGYSQATVTGCDISDNSWGMKLYSASQATVTDSSVSKNKFDGVGLLQEPQITIIGSDISENGGHGISLWESTQATIERSKISRNGECGVFWHACRVIGGKNVIPNRDEPDGNGWGAFCSSGLSFLTTNEGGELDQRRAP